PDPATRALPYTTLCRSVYDTVGLTGNQVFFNIADVTYTFDGGAAGSGAQSTTTDPLHAGLHHFQAHFAGNSDYTATDSPDEPLKINTAPVRTATTCQAP